MTRQIQDIAKPHRRAGPWVSIFALRTQKKAAYLDKNQSAVPNQRADASRRRGQIELRDKPNSLVVLLAEISTAKRESRDAAIVRFGSEANMCGAHAHVRFGPIADIRLFG